MTAISGFLDKGAMAIHGGPFALGLYTPLSELTGRASALGSMVANLFLNDETRSTAPGFGIARRSSPHLLLMDVFFVFAAAGIVAGGFCTRFAGTVRCPIEPFGGAGLQAATGLPGAEHWCSVECRDLAGKGSVRPVPALHCQPRRGTGSPPVLISRAEMVGSAVIVLVLRTADIALIARARPMVSAVQCAAIAAAAIIALALAVSGGITSGSWK